MWLKAAHRAVFSGQRASLLVQDLPELHLMCTSTKPFRTHRGAPSRFTFHYPQVHRGYGSSFILAELLFHRQHCLKTSWPASWHSHATLVSPVRSVNDYAHYRWVAQLWSSERLFHECRERQIAATTRRVRRSLSDWSCDSYVNSMGIHRIHLRIVRGITATT